MSISLRQLNDLVERLAPRDWAEEWDNVGLQSGDPKAAVKRALVALEVSAGVVAEAARRKAQAIVTHHPLIFRPIRSAAEEGRAGILLAELIRRKIGLIAAHTNLDKSTAGPNGALAGALGIEIEGWLRPEFRPGDVKLVVFTPVGHERKIIDAVAAGGGGVIGKYSHCSFRAPGTGTFFPLEGANPYIGKAGSFEEVEEMRLEAVVPKRLLGDVVGAMLKAHPYEEPAYDVYPLGAAKPECGLGVVGHLKNPIALGRLRAIALARLRPLLPVAARKCWRRVGLVGDEKHIVKRVAICTGSGGSLIPDAGRSGVDCLVTGEIDYHAAIEARAMGLGVLCLGHFASEAAAMPHFAQALRGEAERAGAKVEFAAARSETDPFTG